MENWAIVVGINEYWSLDAGLRRAIDDAVEMTRWLTHPKGGNVPPGNLFLLTHPRLGADVQLSDSIRKSGANRDDLIRAIFDLIEQSRGKGERLFFYFSGHGLTSHQEISPKEALIMADFTPRFTDKSFTLNSLWEYFRAAQFPEQFFFIDACRNSLDWNFKYDLGKFPRGEESQIVQSKPSQFLLYATSPELKAKELSEGAAFTQILLDGLKKGAGTAKFFNSVAREYQVPVHLLIRYVRNEIRKKKIVVAEPEPGKPIYQEPTISIPNSDGEFPVLARFEKVPDEVLEIYVEPGDCWAQATITVSNEIGESVAQITPITEAPLKKIKKLPPMTYTIRAQAPPQFAPEQPYWSFDLYEPTRSDVKLRPVDSTSQFKDFEFLDDNLAIRKNLAPRKKTAQLTVESHDSLAPLEISDNNGILQATGNGRLVLPSLKPGIYRASLITPEGRNSVRIVELKAGDEQTVMLDAPPPPETALFDEIVEKTNFNIRENNTVTVSEYVGEMATAQLTTMMTLAASVVRDKVGWADKTRELGLKPFSKVYPQQTTGGFRVTSGLRVVFADESSSDEKIDDYISQIKLSFWQQDQTANKKALRLKPLPAFNRIAQFTREAQPSAYFLSVTLPERRPAIFSVSVLPNRITLFIIHQRPDASLSVLGFSSSFEIREDSSNTSKNLRRLELLQRFYQAGNIGEHAYRDADELLHAKWLDPFAGCLGGYTMLSLNKPTELEVASKNMVKHYGNLSDSHILKAEYLLTEITQ